MNKRPNNYTGYYLLALIIALLPIYGQTKDDNKAQATLPQITLKIGNYSLLTELATTAKQRFAGLSFRTSLDTNAAMLFVYDDERPLHFTMKNASIPLSIAFIDDNLVINEIKKMTPFTRGPWSSTAPARYALEVNQGWFEQHNIELGTKVSWKFP